MYIYTAFLSHPGARMLWKCGGRGLGLWRPPADSKGGVPRERGGRTPWGNPHPGADMQKSPALLQCPTFSPFPALTEEGRAEREEERWGEAQDSRLLPWCGSG